MQSSLPPSAHSIELHTDGNVELLLEKEELLRLEEDWTTLHWQPPPPPTVHICPSGQAPSPHDHIEVPPPQGRVEEPELAELAELLILEDALEEGEGIELLLPWQFWIRHCWQASAELCDPALLRSELVELLELCALVAEEYLEDDAPPLLSQ